jgi:hypothetical protein
MTIPLTELIIKFTKSCSLLYKRNDETSAAGTALFNYYKERRSYLNYWHEFTAAGRKKDEAEKIKEDESKVNNIKLGYTDFKQRTWELIDNSEHTIKL